jgi:hypothetical protein
MSPSHHPCIDVSESEFLGGLSHQPVEERINIKKGITTKTCHVPIFKDQMLIDIKGYAKFVEHQLKMHMGYDGKNEYVINPNENHQ